MPEDTDWGQHEGGRVDLDGNIVRFGSPMDWLGVPVRREARYLWAFSQYRFDSTRIGES